MSYAEQQQSDPRRSVRIAARGRRPPGSAGLVEPPKPDSPFDRVHIDRYTSSHTDELDVYFTNGPSAVVLRLELRPTFSNSLSLSSETNALLSAATGWVKLLNRNILQPALIPYLATKVQLGVTPRSVIERTVSMMFQGDLRPLVTYSESKDNSGDGTSDYF